MAQQYAVNDSEWDEVKYINGYAMFMGYMLMSVRGLGLLIITWTTVVRLAGSGTNFGNKDFWCLTGIMLIQTAGVFNFILKEKISDTVHSWRGFFASLVAMFMKDEEIFIGTKRLVTIFVLVAIQVLVFGVILCALGVVYMLGMYISAGVSLWRLIEHDFGDAGGANQRPALQVLYILAVAQGVLFGYKNIYAVLTGNRPVEEFTKIDKELVEEYIKQTVEGCEENPSFARGRNFVTYGVDLMKEAKSSEGFIAGIKVLGGAIMDEDNEELVLLDSSNHDKSGRKVLAKYLLTRSDSSSDIIQRLLETVGPRSPYIREIKEHVLSILDIIAPAIRLEQFPRAIECLCSAVDTSEESNKLQLNLKDMVVKKFKGHRELERESERYLWGVSLPDDEIKDIIDTYAIVRKYKDARCEKIKDYERVEVLERYEKQYINDEPIALSDKLLFRLQRRLYRCLPCGPLIQRWLVGKRTPEENETKEFFRRADRRLLLKTVNLIHKLVADEDNRWIIRNCVSNTVLHKIAKLPLKLHKDNNCEYEKSDLQMLEQCWVLTEWLLAALTKTSGPPAVQTAATPVGEGPQRETSEEIEEGDEQLLLLRSMDGSGLETRIKRAIKESIESTIKCIFDCFECRAAQKRQAIQILLHLSLDVSSIVEDSESRKRRLGWILLLILYSYDDSKYWMVPSLTYENKNFYCDFDGIRRKACKMLPKMLPGKHELPSEERDRELQLIGLALGDLKSAFYDVAQDISIRTHAVIIMEGLCRLDLTRYSEVERFLVDAIPEVVKETLSLCGSCLSAVLDPLMSRRKARAAGHCNVSQDKDGCMDTQQLQKALASLCFYGYYSYSHSNSTMRSKFKDIASQTCEEQGKSFQNFKYLLRQSIK